MVATQALASTKKVKASLAVTHQGRHICAGTKKSLEQANSKEGSPSSVLLNTALFGVY
jgi:hypothetical protein